LLWHTALSVGGTYFLTKFGFGKPTTTTA